MVPLPMRYFLITIAIYRPYESERLLTVALCKRGIITREDMRRYYNRLIIEKNLTDQPIEKEFHVRFMSYSEVSLEIFGLFSLEAAEEDLREIK